MFWGNGNALRLVGVLMLLAASGSCGDDDTEGNNTNQNQNTSGICGDGVLDTGEQCDAGEFNSDGAPDGCRTDCRRAHCGDGVVDADEACDDGSGDEDDCPDTCAAPVCGDGHVWVGHEVCDDGNTFSGDGCREDCLQDELACGDGVMDPLNDEACDGASLDGQTCESLSLGTGSLACDADCTFNTNGCIPVDCGNGTTETVNGEECDGPDLNLQTCVTQGFTAGVLDCQENCLFDVSSCVSVCGNSIVEPDEECDDGAAVSVSGDGCFQCTLELGFYCLGNPSICASVCGDAIVASDEVCDDGSNIGYGSCEPDCMAQGEFCGDGTINGPEDCEDGDVGGQDCSALGNFWGDLSCAAATCTFDTIECRPNPIEFASGPETTGITLDATYVYWLTGGASGALMKMPIVGGSGVVLATGYSYNVAIAVDSIHAYWCTGENIFRVPLSGGTSETLASNNTYVWFPGSIAVDTTHVYWPTTSSSGSIMKVPLAGGETPSFMATGQGISGRIAVNSTHIYWVSYVLATGLGALRRVPLGGGAIETIASNQYYTQGIAVDATHVYWSGKNGSNAASTGIMKVPLAGGTITTLTTGQGSASRLALDATHVYWLIDQNWGYVRKVPKAGGAVITLAQAQWQPHSIAVGPANVYWTTESPGGVRKTPK